MRQSCIVRYRHCLSIQREIKSKMNAWTVCTESFMHTYSILMAFILTLYGSHKMCKTISQMTLTIIINLTYMQSRVSVIIYHNLFIICEVYNFLNLSIIIKTCPFKSETSERTLIRIIDHYASTSSHCTIWCITCLRWCCDNGEGNRTLKRHCKYLKSKSSIKKKNFSIKFR